jgi:hypothetical protein
MDELIKTKYKFVYTDKYGLKHKMNDIQVLEEPNELPQMLDEFKQFLNMCGYLYVDEVQIKTKQGDIISNIY